jgi:hypothetical protein
VRRFWKRGELDMERELRDARPEPRDEFVRNVEGRVGRMTRPRGARLVLAAGLTAFALVPFAALGGLGEVADAAKGVVSSNSTPATSSNDNPPEPPKQKQYQPKKVTICHKPGTPAEKTMQVPEPAVKGHLGHGDHLGPCT